MPSDPAAARRDAEEARARLLAADSAQARRYAMEECCVALEALLAAEPSAPTVTPVPWLEQMRVIANPIMPKGAIFIHPDTLAGKLDALKYEPPPTPIPWSAPLSAPPATQPGMDWSGTTGTVMPPAPPAPDAVESIVVLTPAHGVAPITITRSAGGLHTAALPAPDAVRVAAEHHVGACTEANGGKLCARCFAALDPLAARDGGGE